MIHNVISKWYCNMCMKAVNQNGLALQHVKNKNIELCQAVIKENHLALQYIDRQN